MYKNITLSILAMNLMWVQATMAMVLDDPTRPPGYPLYRSSGKVKQGPSWHVNAIYISANEKKAMINGKIVRSGEKVNGAEVTQILPGEVRLRKNNQRIVLQLNRTRVKKIYRDE